MYNDLSEFYANPLSFTPANFATLQMPGAPCMVLPNADRMPLGYTVDADGMVNFKFYYPNARSVFVHNALFSTELACEAGFWTGKARYTPGFTACWLVVDGNQTISQFLPICFSDNRPMNFVDIPDEANLWNIQDVPHGVVVEDFLKDSVTGQNERIRVYLPPSYFDEPEHLFPVLYLQHGIGENETAWIAQGKINFVLDNLLADREIDPFIVVMCNGMMVVADENESRLDCGSFHEFLTHDVIPYIEHRYRTAEGQENRVMAGLSMGSIQTSRTALFSPGLFRAIGLFSGFLSDPLDGYNDHLAPGWLAAFKESGTYLFRVIGDADPFLPVFTNDDNILNTAGIDCDRRIYHGSHEWNVWRRCFVDFVQLIFSADRSGTDL